MKVTCVLIVISAYLVMESFCGLVQRPFECETGVPYQENECNSCFCLSNNDLVCTLKDCPENKDKGLEKCQTGNMWKKGCNVCWCVNMGTVCTNYECKS